MTGQNNLQLNVLSIIMSKNIKSGITLHLTFKNAFKYVLKKNLINNEMLQIS